VLQPHGLKLVAVFRGAVGLLTTVKSVELLLVSLQPVFRFADLVALKTVVAFVSEQLALPYPIKSATVTPVGQPLVVVATAVPTTKATLPSVADMLTPVFVASAAGSAVPIVGLTGPSLIRKNCPGATVPDVRPIVLPLENDPVAEAY
jgi:hypothetical protein